MCGIIIAREVIELFANFEWYKWVLIQEREVVDKGLEGMSSLFIFKELAEAGLNNL